RKEPFRRALGFTNRFLAVNESRHLARQRPLRMTTLRLTRARGFELRDLVTIEEREVLQISTGVAIVHVQPELIELVRLRERWIEPHCARFCLSELRSGGGRHQRHDDAVRLPTAHPANEIHPRRDVAPLIPPPHLPL